MAKQTLKISNVLKHLVGLQLKQYAKNDINTNDGRITIKHIANSVSISSGAVYTILKKYPGLCKFSARLMPHLNRKAKTIAG